MSKKGKVLGRDPLFWVRDTRKEKPETSEQGPPEDTPTASAEPGAEPAPGGAAPAVEAPMPSQAPAAEPSALQEPSGPAAAPSSAAVPPLRAAAPPAVTPVSSGYARPALPVSTPEFREPRGMFLAVVLINMLLLLMLGLFGYLNLSSRIRRLEEKAAEQKPPAAAPSGGSVVR